MNVKHFFILFIACCLPFILHAQQRTDVKGFLLKDKTTDRIAQALITNLKTQTIMMSDELGIFSIKAAPGDTLLFNKKGYALHKQVVVNTTDMVVYLQPQQVIELDEVQIKGLTKRQELFGVMQTYRSKGVYYNGKPPALSFLVSPLTGFYELFGKTPGQARRFANFTRTELQLNEVDRRYNKAFVMKTTGLPEDEAQKFMDYYKPSYEDIRAWNDYELIKRVKRQFEYYKKNKDKVPPNPLNLGDVPKGE
jgi:hypothetical protein